MELKDSTVLILGGAGLVGVAVARELLSHGPGRVVIGSLRQEEAEDAVRELTAEPAGEGIEFVPMWGDVFVPSAYRNMHRHEILDDAEARKALLDDLFHELDEGVFQRSTLGAVLTEVSPDVIVDCINTAGALAYQNVFASATNLRERASQGEADLEAVERHLATNYLPQLIRHTQIALEGMKRAGTKIYVKVGTSGTGGMGLNVPFTHSEERPSRVLLAKGSLAGAQTLLLYLMARTPGAPAVKEIKPTAAISWKSIGFGPVTRGGKEIMRVDAVRPMSLDEAFGSAGEVEYTEVNEPLEGVYLNAGENGLFSPAEFETLSALGLMEFVTPEEIAQNVLREIMGHPTGRDIVAALDASTMGPTYRAGVLRSAVLEHMETLESEHGTRSIAYEMLGPPRLAKLLFEAEILRRLYGGVSAGAELDPVATARDGARLIQDDTLLRQGILSIGLIILLPDGGTVLRASRGEAPAAGATLDESVVDASWVDLRETNWLRWKERLTSFRDELSSRRGIEYGSRDDYQYGDGEGQIRPGRMAGWIFRYEDKGERIKR